MFPDFEFRTSLGTSILLNIPREVQRSSFYVKNIELLFCLHYCTMKTIVIQNLDLSDKTE